MKNIRCLTNNPMVIDRGLSFVEALPGISVVEAFYGCAETNFKWLPADHTPIDRQYGSIQKSL